MAGPIHSLSGEQYRVLLEIVNYGETHGHNGEEILAAVEIGLVEDTLHNRDTATAANPAVGWSQEEPEYGSVAERLDMSKSLPRVYNQLRALRGKYGTSGEWAQAIQRFWQEAGVKVSLEGAERPVVLKKVYADYDFDATLQNYSTSGDPALGIVRTFQTASIKQGTNFNNASGYSNPQVDELLDKGRDAADQAGRAKFYFQAQEIIARDLPTLTVHQQAQMGAASS